MTAIAVVPPPAACRGDLASALRDAVARVRGGDRGLVRFAVALLALAALFALLALVDPRTLRGAEVWIKPMKFALSIAIFAATTSFAASAVSVEARRSRAYATLRGAVLLFAGLELFYIALQAGLGEASHYNRSDALHAALYTAMGAAALALTATQPALAWLVARRTAADTPEALKAALVAGLVLTFVLGAGAGIALGAGQPADNGAGLPLLGWTLGRGDLRPAHFLGIHAAQALPAFGVWLAARGVRGERAKHAVVVAAIAWTALFGIAVAAAYSPMFAR